MPTDKPHIKIYLSKRELEKIRAHAQKKDLTMSNYGRVALKLPPFEKNVIVPRKGQESRPVQLDERLAEQLLSDIDELKSELEEQLNEFAADDNS